MTKQAATRRRYALALGLTIGAHALRATATTNVLDHDADIAKVQEWLGHANIRTTRVYNHRKTKPQDSPAFKVKHQASFSPKVPPGSIMLSLNIMAG